MALTFIYGAAGSGKSSYVQELLIKQSEADSSRNFFLIVPDQFSMQAQADIVARSGSEGILNIDVLSFSRLAYRIFEETGKPKETVLDDTGKSLVLRHVASRVADDMPYIGKNLNKTGYIHEIKSSISEFMQYGVGVKDLESIKDKGRGNLFSGKISDLKVIYDAFLKFNEGRYITGEEQLDLLIKKLEFSNIVKDAVFVFDGFTGFTPVQERVILKLLEIAKEVYITLTISEPESLFDNGGPEKLFHLSEDAACRLINLSSGKVSRGEDVDLNAKNPVPHRFKQSPALSHLERNLFRYPYKTFDEPTSEIEMFAAESIRAEVDTICVRILDLIRERGYAYRDIAVVCGSLDNYSDILKRRFEELNIPAFIDKTRGIRLNPFTEFLKSAMKIVTGNYAYDAVFHFLRTGFTEFTAEEVDRFDNYVKSLNIRGKSAYHKDFTHIQRGMKNKDRALLDVAGYNDLRIRLIEKLSCLEKPAKTAKDYVDNLYEFIKNNDSYERLRSMEDAFEAEGDPVKAREYGQVYRLIMDLLDTIVSLVGDIEMSLDDFYKIFDAGVTEITVGTVPQTVDRIVVGDIERTRLTEVKVLFFAGVNEGNIPKDTRRNGILSELDREVFKESGYELAASSRDEMYKQKLYLYLNMCKPTDKLILSYSGSDREGKSLKPSYLCGIMKHMYPKVAVSYERDVPEVSRITSLKDSYRHFAGLLRKLSSGNADEGERNLTKALYSVYKEADGDDLYKTLTDAAFYEYVATPLSREIIDKIYGQIITSSVSRMELFAKCAYAHFLRYGMELKVTADADFNAIDLGNVYHGVLDLFAHKLTLNNITWQALTDDDTERLLDESIEEYVSDYEQGMLKDDARREYTIVKIKRIMKRTIDTLKFQINRGKFTPSGHEVQFRREIEIDDATRLVLCGKVDRVDLYGDGENIYVRIVDYKSSNHDVDISNVYFGLEQQLEVYMREILLNEQKKHPGMNVVPSALLYYKLDNPIVDFDSKDVEKEIRKNLSMKGVLLAEEENLKLNDESVMEESLVVPAKIKKDGIDNTAKSMLSMPEIESLLNYTDRMVKRIGKKVFDGDISVSPFATDKYEACTQCEYCSVCPYDEKTDGFEARSDKGFSPEELRQNVCGGGEDGDYVF
jgi:ATP-dependent helicase/nuclease subunit B